MAKRPNNGGSVSKKVEKHGVKAYTYWRARWTDRQGNVKEKRFDTQDAANTYLTATLAKIQNQTYVEPNKVTVGGWLDEWMREYSAGIKYQTRKSYESAIKEHIKPELGKIKLQSLDKKRIQDFVNGLSVKGKKTIVKSDDGRKEVMYSALAPKSVKNVYGVLRAALEKAVALELLEKNHAEYVTLPRLEKHEKRFLSKTQLNEFLQTAQQDSLRYALQILPLCGLRESELLGLTWDCVDFKKNRLHISKQQVKRRYVDGSYTLDSTKTTKSNRYIQLAPSAMQLLREREKEQIADRFSAGDAWQGFQTENERKTFRVFTNAVGLPINPRVLWRHCKNVLASIGIEDMTVHDLRHTFAVLSLEAGDDIKTISGNLGHSSTSFTLDTYGHVSDAMMNESAARMQALLDSLHVGNG